DEKPEIEPHRPMKHSDGVQLSLLDLWGMTEEVSKEETSKKKKAAKKESAAKRTESKPKVQVTPKVTNIPPHTTSVSPAEKKTDEKKEVEEADKQSDPDDIYASINWEDNPPINGFYEMMMDMTPEKRKALRQVAERHRQEQPKAPTVQQAEHDTEVKKQEEALYSSPAWTDRNKTF
ncbi:N-6 DNA Methylase, partial [human gut metagenome]